MAIRTTGLMILVALLIGSATADAAPLGDDGLHKQEWFALTFKDVAEDLAEAKADGKRLAIVFEQAACVYCSKMHNTVLTDPEVVDYIKQHYIVVQYNLYGDEEVIDLDGEVLSEKSAAAKWNIMFTPTWLFMPEEAEGEKDVGAAAVGTMPGAFGKGTFLDLFTWVREKGYDSEEAFQRYHARRIAERRATGNPDAPAD